MNYFKILRGVEILLGVLGIGIVIILVVFILNFVLVEEHKEEMRSLSYIKERYNLKTRCEDLKNVLITPGGIKVLSELGNSSSSEISPVGTIFVQYKNETKFEIPIGVYNCRQTTINEKTKENNVRVTY